MKILHQAFDWSEAHKVLLILGTRHFTAMRFILVTFQIQAGCWDGILYHLIQNESKSTRCHGFHHVKVENVGTPLLQHFKWKECCLEFWKNL